MRVSRSVGSLLAGVVLLGLGGCAQPHDAEVRAAASSFYRGLASADGSKACDHLAPMTLSQLEDSAAKPCQEAVLEEDVPALSGSGEVQVFGTQAQVSWRGDVTFLARFEDGWKVTAAACTPRAARPYDCAISGG